MSQTDFERAVVALVAVLNDAALYCAGTIETKLNGREDLAIVDLMEAKRRIDGAQRGAERLLKVLMEPLASREAAMKCGRVSAALNQKEM